MSAFPVVLAFPQGLTEVEPQEVQDRADQEAGDPSGRNIRDTTMTEGSHQCEDTLEEGFTPLGGLRF